MNSVSKPLVSIVSPVYNTELYLAECIESVLSQTYENWEYVIVNNCSSDRSLKIAEKYARQDDRIRVHNNERFLMQMQNWNHAMRQISVRSKYCKVVHADDWIFPECISRMVKLAEEHPNVGIVGAYRLDENRVNLDGLPYSSVVVSGRDICRAFFLEGHKVFGSPTSLLIRSDIIRSRKQFYNESNIHADLEVCFDVLQNTDFGFVHQILTFTRRHNETTTTFIRAFDTYLIGALIALKNYGSYYLNRDEYRKVFEGYQRRYYKKLGRSIFRLREKEFRSRAREYFNYHRKALNDLGHPLDLAKILRGALSVLNNRLLNVLRFD